MVCFPFRFGITDIILFGMRLFPKGIYHIAKAALP